MAKTQTSDVRFGPNAITVLPPTGKIELVTHNASDFDVIDAARVSFNKESVPAEDGGVQEGDQKLIQWLIKNHHGTPLEHTFFKFRVRAPIFVFREWHRHRIGVSINEESGRYVKLEGEFWYPQDMAVRKQVGKQGNYSYVAVGGEKIDPLYVPKLGQLDGTHGAHVRDQLNQSYMFAYATYERLLEEGYAKEIARACLPVATYSQMIWSCNARSLMSFLTLRAAPDAQLEIRQYANAMMGIFEETMPVTYRAWWEMEFNEALKK